MIVSLACAVPVNSSSPAPPMIVTASPAVIFVEVKVTAKFASASAVPFATTPEASNVVIFAPVVPVKSKPLFPETTTFVAEVATSANSAISAADPAAVVSISAAVILIVSTFAAVTVPKSTAPVATAFKSRFSTSEVPVVAFLTSTVKLLVEALVAATAKNATLPPLTRLLIVLVFPSTASSTSDTLLIFSRSIVPVRASEEFNTSKFLNAVLKTLSADAATA